MAIDPVLEWCLEHTDNMPGQVEHTPLIETNQPAPWELSAFNKQKNFRRGGRCQLARLDQIMFDQYASFAAAAPRSTASVKGQIRSHRPSPMGTDAGGKRKAMLRKTGTEVAR